MTSSVANGKRISNSSIKLVAVRCIVIIIDKDRFVTHTERIFYILMCFKGIATHIENFWVITTEKLIFCLNLGISNLISLKSVIGRFQLLMLKFEISFKDHV